MTLKSAIVLITMTQSVGVPIDLFADEVEADHQLATQEHEQSTEEHLKWTEDHKAALAVLQDAEKALKNHIAAELKEFKQHEAAIQKHTIAIAEHEKAGNNTEPAHTALLKEHEKWKAQHDANKVLHDKLMQGIQSLKAAL